MGWYDELKAVEEEILEILRASETDPLRAVHPESIQRGIRRHTDYVHKGAFPFVEAAVAEASARPGGTQTAEHAIGVDLAAWVKTSEPERGVEMAKELWGSCYDELDAKPDLDCGADFLREYEFAVMPAARIGSTNWVYLAAGVLQYRKRF